MENSKEKSPEVRLKVAEANQYDVYKGIVRIDAEVMRKIGVRVGDPVEIEGTRKTVAIAQLSLPQDVGLGIIRMDIVIRKNAGVSLGSYVIVRKANVKEAKKVILAPSQKNVVLNVNNVGALKRYLINRPVVKGDNLVISWGDIDFFGRRRIFGRSFFDEDTDEDNIFPFFDFGGFFGGELRLSVVNTQPSGEVIITENTDIEILPQAVEVSEVPEVAYEDIGGMDEVVRKVRELVELPLKYPEIFEKLGIEPPKGILLYGPPGTGKTLLAKAVANESGAAFFSINGPEIVSKYVGESEERLRKIFEEAKKKAPSIIFIDEIDAIAPKRDESVGEVERRLVAQLLTLMDGLKERGKVIVIAATNRPDAIDPALRRPGRFDREIAVPVPNEQGRYEILKIHTRKVTLGKKDENGNYIPLSEEEREELLRKLARETYGYTGADLAALVKEAGMNVIRRVWPKLQLLEKEYNEENNEEREKIYEEIMRELMITEEDFREALKVVPPSGMREVLVEIPKVKWEDIGGLEDVKQQLREMVEWPVKYKEVFEKLGIEPPKGILLYGPPGTGKTLLAKALATETGANFIAIRGPELFNKFFGETEKAIRNIFRKARELAPAIIFFDEIDAIVPRRGAAGVNAGIIDPIINQLLAEMDGISSRGDVVVVGATNRPDVIDPAVLRPGRFDRIIYVPPPDEKARYEILKIHTRKIPIVKRDEKGNLVPMSEEEKDKLLQDIAKQTENYTGADLELLVKEAAMMALRENIKYIEEIYGTGNVSIETIKKKLESLNIGIEEKHLRKALEIVKPSVTPEMINFYKTFAETFRKGFINTGNKYYG